MLRKTTITLALAAFAMTGAGCNTVKGLGRDIESVGQAGEEVISQAPRGEEQDAQRAR